MSTPDNHVRGAFVGVDVLRKLSFTRSLARLSMLAFVATPSLGCESKVVLATWSCPEPHREAGGATSTGGLVGSAGTLGNSGAAGAATTEASEATRIVAVPWHTGFEDGFCDYSKAVGNCAGREGRLQIVTEPVHSGLYAAAYTSPSVVPDVQSRCAVAGNFPVRAYYGAWYYIPVLPKQFEHWNLFHYQATEPNGGSFSRVWDVTLLKKPNGDLRLEVYDFGKAGAPLPDQSNAPSVPIGKWFHIELFVKRAVDLTGEYQLYQDGQSIFRITGVHTDTGGHAQWYVGNLAENMDPVESTVYVDDVSIRAAR